MTPDPIRFAVAGTVVRADIPTLCADLAARLGDPGGGVVICDVAAVSRPCVATVEALARLRLTARRHGWTLLVHGAGPDLRDLVGLLGLADALPQACGEPEDALLQAGGEPEEALLQAGREPEEREQAVGVEERVHGADPVS